MEEWKEYKLKEVATLTTGFPFDGHKYQKEGIRVVRGDNVTIGSLRWDTDKDKRWMEPFERASEYTLEAEDIVIGMDGSRVGKNRACVKKEDLPLFLAQRVACVRHNSLSIQSFLYYHIFSNKFEDYIKAVHTGTSIPHVSLKQIGEFSFPLPPIETQKRIASILSSLDDKIELNRKINANLEAQAQALFKSWFVDFEPFKDQPFVESELGMIPEGWRVVSLGDLMSYNGGSQPPASEFIEEYKEGYVRFVQIRDYASDGHITYIPVSKRNKLCDVRDIMIARYGASLGRICYGLKGAYNVALAKVTPNKPFYLEYLRCFFNTREFYEGINNKGNRAVQAGFNQSDIQSFRVVFPKDEEIIQRFENICSVSFDKRLHLEQESRRLASLRDTLLPRLMSGELKVNDINI